VSVHLEPHAACQCQFPGRPGTPPPPTDKSCGVQVLEAISDHREQLKPDSLQELHACHNLSVLLAEGEMLPEPASLAEGNLRKNADLIREVCHPDLQCSPEEEKVFRRRKAKKRSTV